MKINIAPGVIIFIFGFIGLIVCLAEGQGQIGSKVPLALFFLLIMGSGIAIQIKSDSNLDEFGEMEGNRGYG